MDIEIEKLSKLIGWWSVIIGAAFTVWLTVEGYFATRAMVERYNLRRINADISINEKTRDSYQYKKDLGAELEPHEKRRHGTTNFDLDNLYQEKQDAMEFIKELEK